MAILGMLQQSLFLTLLGLGVVFSFLIVLIVFMNLTHMILHALKLDREEEKAVTPSVAPSAGNDGAVVAAIAAAIKEKQS